MNRPASPTTVLFVHGLGGTPEVWGPIADRFDGSYTLLSPEMPWSGRQNRGWSARPPAEWIRRTLLQVRTPSCVIVAHSFGANAVLEYLDAHGAGTVERVALVCPFYDAGEAGSDAEDRFSLENFQRLIEDGFRRSVHSRRVPPEILTSMAQRVRERVGREGWREFLRVFRRTSTLRLAALDVPCLLMAGEDDKAAPPDAVAALGTALPASTLVRLARCGHFSITEQPGLVLDALHVFLASSGRGNLCAAS